MPKVTQEYIDNKRKMIVDSAYQVCLRKPVEMVTISDVIAETGMSQGAIYRYYVYVESRHHGDALIVGIAVEEFFAEREEGLRRHVIVFEHDAAVGDGECPLL